MNASHSGPEIHWVAALCAKFSSLHPSGDGLEASDAHAVLVQSLFGVHPEHPTRDPRWTAFAFFDGNGRCVGGVEAARVEFVADGRVHVAGAIRRAGVAVPERGRGLFRQLMTRALDWCAAHCDGPVLLYTEKPALYSRFGFRALAQHAFVGTAPRPSAVPAAAYVDGASAARLVGRLAPTRTAVSDTCAVLGATDLLLAHLRDDDDLTAAYAADLDSLIIHETDGDELVIVDVVAAAMPTMAQIVGALRSPCPRLRVLFPPDRLEWSGMPEIDDAGLMVRGAVPDAMTRPFMLPPTTAF